MGLARDERAAAAAGKGCLGRAGDDEPVFILRGQDALAASLVEQWAYRAGALGCTPAKVDEALALAEKMRLWPTRKNPD